MRGGAILLGLVVAGVVAVGIAALSPGARPVLVTVGAGLFGAGVVGIAIAAIDAVVAREQNSALSKADRLVVALGAGAVFVRVGLVHLVADPLRADGALLTALAVSAVGVVVGYRTADHLVDGLRHGVLACGLGGALCVLLAAYGSATGVIGVGPFDVLVAVSGLVLPIAFGAFGGVSGALGCVLARRFARADPLA